MASDQVASALQQIESTKTECAGLLRQMREFSPPDDKGRYHDTFRLIATPMLYSAWERCFTLCHAIALRLIRDTATTAHTLDTSLKAVWLQQEGFYQSFIAQLRKQEGAEGSEKPKKGNYTALCDFISKLDGWSGAALNESVETEKLVMTFSNVNGDVVEVDARAIGIAEHEVFKQIKLEQLHELVGRRNDIGHGGKVKAPDNPDFERLLNFTEGLITSYCDAFISWIGATFDRESLTEPA